MHFQLFFLTYLTVVKTNIQDLKSVVFDQDFDLFLKYNEKRSSEIDMSISMLEHNEIVEKRYEVGKANPEYPASV